MNYFVAAAIGMGLLVGALAGYTAGRRIVLWAAEYAQRPTVVRASGGIAGLVAFLPSIFLAFVVGGDLGGGWGAWLLPEAIGVPLGLALGIAAILALGLLVGASFGALLGSGISVFLGRTHEA